LLSKNKIKFIRSLEQKKYRRQEGAFVAEGHKTVGDLLSEGFKPLFVVHTEEWNSPVPLPYNVEEIVVSDEELRKASLLAHPQQVICVFILPEEKLFSAKETTEKELILCLDGVQDPGNLGTIIRTADWFGIKHIVCSQQTADAFAPKVVQATMGSIARVQVHYGDITSILKELNEDTPIYGTFLEGDSIYAQELKNNGVIVMGNEGNGISEEVEKLITHKITIPSYHISSTTAESLNVSIATAIICSEFRRQNVKLL
jgi:TrmH family RNA methyltransferase